MDKAGSQCRQSKDSVEWKKRGSMSARVRPIEQMASYARVEGRRAFVDGHLHKLEGLLVRRLQEVEENKVSSTVPIGGS